MDCVGILWLSGITFALFIQNIIIIANIKRENKVVEITIIIRMVKV